MEAFVSSHSIGCGRCAGDPNCTGQAHSLVFDKTGLTGQFDFTLEFTSTSQTALAHDATGATLFWMRSRNNSD